MQNREQHVLLAKQPIYQHDLALYGFELLFRSPLQLNAEEVGEEQATSQVLVNYCTSVTNEVDKHQHPLFINVSEGFLLSEAFLPIDKNVVVIELLERIKVTPELTKSVHSWHRNGYRFALDDYDFNPRWDPLLPLISYIKIDIMEFSLPHVVKQRATKQLKKGVLWVAERIEDQATLQKCMEAGFDLFQGYFLARPKELLGNTIRPSSAMTVQIIRRASQHNVNIKELAELVSQDPKLAMQLLKLINSSLFTLPREINDLKEAITFLGIDVLKKWAMMIAFVSEAACHMESCRIILVRAKCCELYVEHVYDDSDLAATAFLAGLLSGVDVLLEIKPEVFLHEMQLGAIIQAAVLNKSGALGQTISTIENIEHAVAQSNITAVTEDKSILSYYLEAQKWAEDVINTLESKS